MSEPPVLLVVDDEVDVGEVIVEFGRRLGYDARLASSPETFDASYADHVAAVVLDLWMPGADGIELLRRLAARGSTARIVLVSGVEPRVLEAARAVAEDYGLNIVGTLSKPVRLADLAQLLGDHTAPAARTEPVAASDDVSVGALRDALDANQLVVHFQPQLSLETGRIVGLEALVRWDRNGTLLPPDRFVQIAEAGELSLDLTWGVIEQVAREAAELAERRDLWIAVNLPPAALTDVSFPDRVVTHLRRTGLAVSRLHFEITETSVVREGVAALDILTRLRLKGFALAIDDFGTGYASLSQLRRLPFSALKIDKSFVGRMDRDPASAAIVHNCVELGHDLGLTVIAEGVESDATCLALKEAGCDIVQGYAVGRPAPAGEIGSWLQGRHMETVEKRCDS
jgi:EAL domain-containing protein (putative c-di-GMP-specific phosphodiesterase class I)/FixJ family two-component response regulator